MQFSRRTKATASFRIGNEFRSNVACSFSAACVVKLLHTSRKCFLSLLTVMHCGLNRSTARDDLIILRTFTMTFGPRGLQSLHGTHFQQTCDKHGSVSSCRTSVVLWLTISLPRRETPGSIPTSTKKIHDIYGAILRKILCLAAICAAG